MGYAEKNLAPGESILYRARYHWIFYRLSLLLLVLAVLLGASALYASRNASGHDVARLVGWGAAGFAVLGLVLYLARRIRASADEFVVTNRRVMRKTGLFAREAEQVPIEKIQDVTVEQGVLARMLGYGTVLVETASERRGMLDFPDIARPEAFRNALWGRPVEPAAPGGPTSGATGLTPRQRLAELENLKQQGLVSQEEYAAKRSEILSHL